MYFKALAASGLAIIYYNKHPLITSIGFALIGCSITAYLIPRLSQNFVKIGLKGVDMSKSNKPTLPETMGAVSATVYMFLMVFFIPFAFLQYLVVSTSGGGNREEGIDEVNYGRSLHKFPHDKLSEWLSALLCFLSMLMLGFADDLFDIRWRNKFFLPAIAAVPLLVVYYVDFGVTRIMLPPMLGLGSSIDLGGFYYVYMAATAVFCTNCINIYAGVNGLEAGQSLVIGVILLINDLLYILTPNHPAAESHLLSAYFIIPFLGVTLPLVYYNWFPAKVFVGDTFCYFSGMVFAVSGILGHFSKTLLLFLVPQIFNFVYSAPQLFKLVDCPRHRLPKVNKQGKMEPSRTRMNKYNAPVIRFLSKFKLVQVYEETNECSNLTLINLVLVWVGPLQENNLTTILLILQFISGIGAIVVRHSAAALIFGRDNWQLVTHY